MNFVKYRNEICACGKESKKNTLSDVCDRYEYCKDCGKQLDTLDADSLFYVYDRCNNQQPVCESCYCENYIYCERCDRELETISCNFLDNYGLIVVCDECLAKNFTECDCCGENILNKEIIKNTISKKGDKINICKDCYKSGKFV